MNILKSEQLEVKINSKGAEIVSVLARDGVEFIWQADPGIWPRHTPVLFPIVGRLKDDIYFFENSQYTLGQHGFARDLEFTLTESETSFCSYKLKSDNSTKIKYPFDFVFNVHYSLKNNLLEVRYEVLNNGSTTLFFSVGAHPGFRCPLLPEEKMEDYVLRFEKNEFSQTMLDNGLRSSHKKLFKLQNNSLLVRSSLFDQDALVFEDAQINHIELISEKSGRGIELNCHNWPYFGIWSKKGCTDFVCLEPWYGVADRSDSNQQLTKKDGIIALQAGSVFECMYNMRFL